MKPGTPVRIKGYPLLFPWMKDYVGREGVAREVGERALAVEMEGETLWLAKAFVEPLVSEEAG